MRTRFSCAQKNTLNKNISRLSRTYQLLLHRGGRALVFPTLYTSFRTFLLSQRRLKTVRLPSFCLVSNTAGNMVVYTRRLVRRNSGKTPRVYTVKLATPKYAAPTTSSLRKRLTSSSFSAFVCHVVVRCNRIKDSLKYVNYIRQAHDITCTYTFIRLKGTSLGVARASKRRVSGIRRQNTSVQLPCRSVIRGRGGSRVGHHLSSRRKEERKKTLESLWVDTALRVHSFGSCGPPTRYRIQAYRKKTRF